MAGSGAPTFSEPPLLWVVPAGHTIVRIHQTKDDAVWFGPAPGTPPAYRFDAPAGQFRTLYAARQLDGAFAETILRRARRIVAWPYVELRQWTVLQVERELTQAKLFDKGLIRHGVTGDICAGDDYRASQALSHALYAAFPELDGIAYRARHDNGEICYALFDRVDPSRLRKVDARRFAQERPLTDALMRLYGASWDPLDPLPDTLPR